ncbi:hypothetical protein [uncultured Roseobacter sp.]|uniref:hypothetical protein n=1 Tax=uncultured Roseobacter sp. TaxID=114847 RepID=UPI002634628B|nr:hypothetical protein [uncultured Roseobacter sp.]
MVVADSERPERKITDRLRKLAAYFSACLDLRNSITLQKYDESFAREERGSIKYVFDSNMVRFFLDPMRESAYVNPFLGEDTAAYRKLAIITAEFIFSREMEGQWGVPASISKEHMVELSNHMDKLSRRLDEHANRLETVSKLENASHQEDAIRLAQSGNNIAASVEAFNSTTATGADWTEDGILRELREAQMLDRIRRQDLLLPMSLDENATLQVLEPSPQAVHAWEARIKEQRQEASQKKKRNPKQDRADAITAEQIIQLNRNVAEGVLAPTRYVLVTLDRNFFNAAVEWWEAEGRQELDFFPFRRISQYIPFLNTERLPNSLSSGQISKDLKIALDSLLGMGARRRHKVPLYIPEPTVSPPKGSFAGEVFVPLQWISKQWDDVAPVQRMIVDLWREMTERVNYLNPELLSRRDEAFENFREYLANSPNTRQAAVTYLRQAVEKIDKFNIELSIAHSIASEIIRRPKQQPMQAVRGMPVLREQFAPIIGNQPLYPLLDKVVLKQDVAPLSSIVKKIDEAELWRSAFFAGCVAFWVGQWDGAAVYARRAAAALRSEERCAELAYFQVLTARFAALDMPNNTSLELRPALARVYVELTNMEHDVNEMLRAAAKSDLFAQCRARVERTHWILSRAYVQAFRQNPQGEDLETTVIGILDELNLIRDDLAGLSHENLPAEALKTMQIEHLVGIAGVYIFQEKLTGAAVDSVIKRDIASSIEAWVSENPGIAPSLYTVTLPLLSNKPDAADQIDTILQEGHHMTWFDKIALGQMRDLALA